MNDTKMCFFLEYKPSSLCRSPPIPIFDIGIQEPFLIYLRGQDSRQDSIDSIEKIKFHCYVRTFGYLECTAPPKNTSPASSLPLFKRLSSRPPIRTTFCFFVFSSFFLSYFLSFLLSLFKRLSSSTKGPLP